MNRLRNFRRRILSKKDEKEEEVKRNEYWIHRRKQRFHSPFRIHIRYDAKKEKKKKVKKINRAKRKHGSLFLLTRYRFPDGSPINGGIIQSLFNEFNPSVIVEDRKSQDRNFSTILAEDSVNSTFLNN